jgi:hypothetical protein
MRRVMCERTFARDHLAWCRTRHAELRAAAIRAESRGDDFETVLKLQLQASFAERDLQNLEALMESS